MANKNVNDSKIKTHILTKKVQLIVDTDRFDTDEEKIDLSPIDLEYINI